MPESATQRRQSIDLMRIVAAFGIVWAHMQAPGMILGYVALALFLVLTAFLSLRSLARDGSAEFWRTRITRLALPWVVWSAVFLALDAVRFGWRAAVTVEDPLSLLVGPSIHLWFLPFVLLASLSTEGARALLTTRRRVWVAALALVPLAAAAASAHDSGLLPDPFRQWAFAVTPFLYGLLSAAGQARGVVGAPLAFAGLVTGVAVVGWGSGMAPFVLAAALLFEALWRLPLRHPALPVLGAMSYGIYLTHPIFMLGWYAVGTGPAAVGALVVFAASAAAAGLLAVPARTRLGNRLSGAGRGAGRPAPGEA